jgi:hypothetical protein
MDAREPANGSGFREVSLVRLAEKEVQIRFIPGASLVIASDFAGGS